jgi:hypothetical protein
MLKGLIGRERCIDPNKLGLLRFDERTPKFGPQLKPCIRYDASLMCAAGQPRAQRGIIGVAQQHNQVRTQPIRETLQTTTLFRAAVGRVKHDGTTPPKPERGLPPQCGVRASRHVRVVQPLSEGVRLALSQLDTGHGLARNIRRQVD